MGVSIWRDLLQGACFVVALSAAAGASAMPLRAAGERAVTTNPQVGEAAANREATEFELDQARGGYLPSIDLEARRAARRPATDPARRAPGAPVLRSRPARPRARLMAVLTAAAVVSGLAAVPAGAAGPADPGTVEDERHGRGVDRPTLEAGRYVLRFTVDVDLRIESWDAAAVATGHYARVTREAAAGRWVLGGVEAPSAAAEASRAIM